MSGPRSCTFHHASHPSAQGPDATTAFRRLNVGQENENSGTDGAQGRLRFRPRSRAHIKVLGALVRGSDYVMERGPAMLFHRGMPVVPVF